MSQYDVVVVDYGLGNLLSVRRGLEHCGASVGISRDPDIIQSASRLVLPGVGAFSNAMTELHRLQLVDVLRSVAARGVPLLGICLGMQLLLDESEEFGRTSGLGLIHGCVVPVNARREDGSPLKVPHIAWSELISPNRSFDFNGGLLKDVKSGESVYFVHSYMARPTDSKHVIAECEYGNLNIPAVICRENISGCQFHPEKSGESGLKILRGFLSL